MYIFQPLKDGYKYPITIDSVNTYRNINSVLSFSGNADINFGEYKVTIINESDFHRLEENFSFNNMYPMAVKVIEHDSEIIRDGVLFNTLHELVKLKSYVSLQNDPAQVFESLTYNDLAWIECEENYNDVYLLARIANTKESANASWVKRNIEDINNLSISKAFVDGNMLFLDNPKVRNSFLKIKDTTLNGMDLYLYQSGTNNLFTCAIIRLFGPYQRNAKDLRLQDDERVESIKNEISNKFGILFYPEVALIWAGPLGVITKELNPSSNFGFDGYGKGVTQRRYESGILRAVPYISQLESLIKNLEPSITALDDQKKGWLQ